MGKRRKHNPEPGDPVVPYSELTFVAELPPRVFGMKSGKGYKARYWRVRCSCGREMEGEARRYYLGHVERCRTCQSRAYRARGR